MQNSPQGGMLPQLDGILESVPLVRIDRFDNEVLVVYAVLTLESADNLAFGSSCCAQPGLGESSLAGSSNIMGNATKTTAQIALIDAISYDATGHVDEASLMDIPVLDAERWPVQRCFSFESQLLLKIVGCFTATQPLNNIIGVV